MITKTDDEIWYWYQHIETQRNSGLDIRKYCEDNQLDYKKFVNTKTAISWRKYSNVNSYKVNTSIAKEYLDGPLQLKDFCNKHKANKVLLQAAATHLKYLEIIERLKKEREPQPMNFVKISNTNEKSQEIQVANFQPQEELMEKQNDLEIIISKGVKVSISPNIDSLKIIKIIELLKDL